MRGGRIPGTAFQRRLILAPLLVQRLELCLHVSAVAGELPEGRGQRGRLDGMAIQFSENRFEHVLSLQLQ